MNLARQRQLQREGTQRSGAAAETALERRLPLLRGRGLLGCPRRSGGPPRGPLSPAMVPRWEALCPPLHLLRPFYGAMGRRRDNSYVPYQWFRTSHEASWYNRYRRYTMGLRVL